MPVKGRKPKGQTISPARHVHGWTEVENTPHEGGPRLPARRANGQPWSASIRRKWRAWSTMPHCRLWHASDWSFALDTIELAAQFHEGGKASAATELRYRERILGTTVDARRDLRITYVDPRPKLTTVPTAIAEDYRNL